MASSFSIPDFLGRWLFAACLVFGTFNPTGYSYFGWMTADTTEFGPVPALASIALLIAWIGFVRDLDPGWERYETRRRPVMEFGDRFGLLEDPGARERESRLRRSARQGSTAQGKSAVVVAHVAQRAEHFELFGREIGIGVLEALVRGGLQPLQESKQ